VSFDATDRKILSILREDGRASHAAIAKRVGLSAPAVGERVRKLEQSGVIKGYRAILNPAALERDVSAYVAIAPQPRYPAAHLVENLMPLFEIEELHAVAGEHGYIAKVRVASTEELDAFLDRLWMVEGVERTVTTVILRTTVDRPIHLAFEDAYEA
jgi:Lrp/AsnC family transcriptional regulator, leucine-responsive regulatory protein